jgi:hypothetical protein
VSLRRLVSEIRLSQVKQSAFAQTALVKLAASSLFNDVLCKYCPHEIDLLVLAIIADDGDKRLPVDARGSLRQSGLDQLTCECRIRFSHGFQAPDVRKPALDLSDVVRQPCTVITGASQ